MQNGMWPIYPNTTLLHMISFYKQILIDLLLNHFDQKLKEKSVRILIKSLLCL